ncbi:MAG: hypothetical protein RSC68_02730 [Acinetobacter sp.]
MSHEELLEQIESAANFVRGIQFDQRLLNDAREALRERAMELDDFVDNYSNENASKWCIKTSRQGAVKSSKPFALGHPHLTYKKFSISQIC